MKILLFLSLGAMSMINAAVPNNGCDAWNCGTNVHGSTASFKYANQITPGTSDVCTSVISLGYRTTTEIKSMSNEDCRNILIVELSHFSPKNIPQLQAMTNSELVEDIYLRMTTVNLGFRTTQQIKQVTTGDCKNTLIVELKKLTSDSISTLQSLSALDLIYNIYMTTMALSYGVRTETDLRGMSLGNVRNMFVVELQDNLYDNALKGSKLLPTSYIQSFPNVALLNNFLGYKFQTNSANTEINTLSNLLSDLSTTSLPSNQIKFDAKAKLTPNGQPSIPMHAINIIQINNIYYAVYHNKPNNEYNIGLASSTNLIDWVQKRILLTNADMPYLYQIPGTTKLLLAHEQWIGVDSTSPSKLGFKIYDSENDLLVGTYSSTYTAPLTLGAASSLEGTPNIYKATIDSNGCIESKIGFHYFDSNRWADQNGYGKLSNFGCSASTTFSTEEEKVLNKEMNNIYNAVGNIGQRDIISDSSLINDYVIIEGNVQSNGNSGGSIDTVWEAWKMWIYESKNANNIINYNQLDYGNFYMLNIETPQRANAFGNPSVKIVDCPNTNNKCLFASYFIFSEGAQSGEPGQCIFYKELSTGSSAVFEPNNELLPEYIGGDNNEYADEYHIDRYNTKYVGDYTNSTTIVLTPLLLYLFLV